VDRGRLPPDLNLEVRGETLPPRSAWPALGVLGILLIGFGNGVLVWAGGTASA
jgi:hypothetical protein